jgi:hypothetical protein
VSTVKKSVASTLWARERRNSGQVARAQRVEAGKLSDSAMIGGAADRILRDSGVSRCFTTIIRQGSFTLGFDKEALAYEEKLLASRYLITISLTKEQASTTDMDRHYRMLQNVERRFRITKDFLDLRPVHHRLEERIRGHIAPCVIAAVIEAVMGIDLEAAAIKDLGLPEQTMSPRRALAALAELAEIRFHWLNAGWDIEVIDCPSPLQRQILDAFAVDTSTWGKAKIA